jgi:hypothetical protein
LADRDDKIKAYFMIPSCSTYDNNCHAAGFSDIIKLMELFDYGSTVEQNIGVCHTTISGRKTVNGPNNQ